MAPRTYQIQQLLEKMLSPDQDFRFMALNDLMTEVSQEPTLFQSDEASEVKVINQVLSLIEDKISEVKNQAVKCLGQLIKIIREKNLPLVVNKLIQFSSGKDEELRDVAGLALKTVVSELPPDGSLAQSACQKLVPRLLEQLKSSSTPPETLIETLSTLSVVVTRFPQHIVTITTELGEKEDPIDVMVPLLAHNRSAVRKRAIITLSQFVPLASPARFATLMTTTVTPALAPKTPLETQKTVIQLLGGIARYAPHSLDNDMGQIVPGVLAASSRDDSDLREGCLQTLEALALKCPSELVPFLPQIIPIASEMVKYDPNYTQDEVDDDEEMEDGDDDDDDDDAVDDAYSDDEDTSYKVRRSAVKLLSSIIETRPELLSTIYATVSPVLISRFGDREDSVKLEIWSTYALLIKQTGIYGGADPKKAEGMDVENNTFGLLKGQVPAISKGLLKQLKPKSSPATLQAGLNLLQSLLEVLPGSLSAQVDPITSICSSVLSSPPNTSTSALHSTALAFLSLFFSSHPSSTFKKNIPRLTPQMLTAAPQRHPRVASEALKAFVALLVACRPVETGDWAGGLYDIVLAKLKSNETDLDVRQRAEDALVELWICAPEMTKKKGGAEWDVLLKGGRTEGAVEVVSKVAGGVAMGDGWVSTCTEWAINLLKKPGKVGKAGVFVCLEVLLKQFRTVIDNQIPETLVPQLHGYFSLHDLVLLTQALNTCSVLLEQAPKDTFPLVEKSLLHPAYQLAHSPLVTGSALEALTNFYCALVVADPEIATRVVPGLVAAIEKHERSESSPENVSKCISAVVRGSPAIAAGVIAEFAKAIKPGSKSKEVHVVLSLMALGEIGKTIDMERQPEVFNNSVALFAADTDAVRSAAAFAAGNISVGNTQHFLPIVVNLLESKPDDRILTLNALKEVVSNCPRSELEMVAKALWTPLFELPDNGEESSRNVAAACLGKLATADPSQHLPELQSRLTAESPTVRARVVAAIRYTFVDSNQSYDDVLSALLVDFLPLIHDPDLTVRRLALLSLNAAARNKPHLIREHLPSVMPMLYTETKPNPDLIRIVEMGPWKHKVDDGLEARKTAYETMYTILDTCLDRIDIYKFLEHVFGGLKDDSNEIKVLCHMMLFRLAQVAPTAVSQQLDNVAPALMEGMKGHDVQKNTVKQDLERTAELQRSTLRAIVALSKISNPGAAPQFDKVVEGVSRPGQPWAQEFRELL